MGAFTPSLDKHSLRARPQARCSTRQRLQSRGDDRQTQRGSPRISRSRTEGTGGAGGQGRAVSPLWKEQDPFLQYLGLGWGMERELWAESVVGEGLGESKLVRATFLFHVIKTFLESLSYILVGALII